MSGVWGRAGVPVQLLLAALLCIALSIGPVLAVDRVQLHATAEAGFGRIVLEFPGRFDLPAYKVNFDNNVLSITFDQPVSMPLPDVNSTLPGYLTVARVDPDGRGVRFGLRNAVSIHSMEAGERLFIDMMPANWQGLPPSLPPQVIAELSDRARTAAIVAEQNRKALEAKALNPTATLRVGRNPTFVRVEFDWSVDTKGEFHQDGSAASIKFDWPVPVDLYALKADLPPEILGVANNVSVSGSSIDITLIDGVEPRFYTESPTRFTLDIDLSSEEAKKIRLSAETAAQQAEADAAAARAAEAQKKAELAALAGQDLVTAEEEYVPGRAITPMIDEVSGTIRGN